jgi:hypothetical protein
MSEMSLQERYDEVSSISGLSEDIIRRVYKATKESMAQSLKRGERATLPGICTITPEIKSKINYKEGVVSNYIKLKAKPSTAMESELDRLNNFDIADNKEKEQAEEEGLKKLNYMTPELKTYSYRSSDGIRTKQISALL